MGRYLPVPAADWPQDSLRTPGVSAGQMPPLSRANREFVRREATVFTLPIGAFTNLGGEGIGGQVQTTIPTDQDGDFWCDQIFLSAFRDNARSFYGGPLGTLAFTDIRTDQTLMFGLGGSPLYYFALGNTASGAPFLGGQLFFHGQNFPARGQLPQPFPFTRQGGIRVTFTSVSPDLGAAFHYRLNLAFSGWKEYAYDS